MRDIPVTTMSSAFAYAAADLPVPLWMGDVRILEDLGEGGMGRVFRALDTRACRMVALKRPRTGSPLEVASLRHEAAILKRLRHPGIVTLLGDGTWDGLPWAAFELLEGRTLLEVIEASWAGRRRREEMPTRIAGRPRFTSRELAFGSSAPIAGGRFEGLEPATAASRPSGIRPNLEEIADIAGQLGAALDHLHGRGIVHRDVKPSNVFVSERGKRRRITLLDFGVACAAGTSSGPEAFCIGTLEYAAPEQIGGDPVDSRADIYSFGCVLYELCTGLRPFEGDSAHEVAQMHLYRAAVAPSALGAEVPRRIDELILEMLEKRPSERPASAGTAATRFASGCR